ncbi:MAG: hypothetical protein M3340_19765 [Actinomycetota bacterium]|nr:hypothetical protein [Actinomycetota bacterium]
MRRLLALLLLALAAAGCGDDPASPNDDPATGPADKLLEPARVARAYVEAIDRRDGKRVCSLVAPYISGRWDLSLKDPDGPFPPGTDCGEFVAGRIDYEGDCCPDRFLHARVRKAAPPREDGDLMRVDLTIDLEIDEDSGSVHERRVVKPLADVVWLAEVDGAWRVAKLSAVARAASLYPPDEGARDEDPLARPDVVAERRRHEEELAASERESEERAASYEPAGDPPRCEGGVRLGDRRGDVVDYRHPAPRTPIPRIGQVDLRGFRIASRNRRICATWEAAGPIEGGLELKLGIGGNQATLFSQLFLVDLRRDGTVRVTSGEDEQRNPIPVPAEFGVEGNRATLVVDAESFARGRPSPHSTGPPPFDRFRFSAALTHPVDARRTLHDDLGPYPTPESFQYPGGEMIKPGQ